MGAGDKFRQTGEARSSIGSARACVDEHKTRRYRVVGGSLRGLVTPLFSAGVNCFVFVLECDRACSRICPRSSRKGARATRRW